MINHPTTHPPTYTVHHPCQAAHLHHAPASRRGNPPTYPPILPSTSLEPPRPPLSNPPIHPPTHPPTSKGMEQRPAQSRRYRAPCLRHHLCRNPPRPGNLLTHPPTHPSPLPSAPPSHLLYNPPIQPPTHLQIHANCRLRRVYFAERQCTEEELPPEFRLFQPVKKGGGGGEGGVGQQEGGEGNVQQEEAESAM